MTNTKKNKIRNVLMLVVVVSCIATANFGCGLHNSTCTTDADCAVGEKCVGLWDENIFAKYCLPETMIPPGPVARDDTIGSGAGGMTEMPSISTDKSTKPTAEGIENE